MSCIKPNDSIELKLIVIGWIRSNEVQLEWYEFNLKTWGK